MAIDPSIIGGLKPFQMEGPVNSLAQLLKVQSLQQDNQLGQAKLDEYTRSKDRSNKLIQLVQGLPATATDDDRINAMKGGGYFDEADKLQTGMLARQKTGAEVGKDNATAAKTSTETLGLKLQHHKDQLGTVADPQSGALWVKAMFDDPDMAPIVKMSGKTLEQVVAAIPQDPAGFEKWKLQSSLGADKMVEYTTANANTVANNKTSVLTTQMNNTVARASQAQQERASLRADARAADTLKQGKTPVGYRQAGDGSLVPIPGGPADPSNKPPTEFQGKSAAFGARAEEADRVLQTLDKAGTDKPGMIKRTAEGIPLVGGALGSWVNGTQSAAQQSVEQAQRDFVNAVLRQESGAAIGAGEFDNAQKQYFPQNGDSAAVIEQKARNRQLSVQGLKNNAGHAAFSAPGAAGNAGPIKVTGADDYAKVPSGSNYITPDGHTRRKP